MLNINSKIDAEEWRVQKLKRKIFLFFRNNLWGVHSSEIVVRIPLVKPNQV